MARTAAPPQFTPIVPLNPHEPITPETWVNLCERWPHAERLTVAMRLANDIDTCRALLRGEPVDPARIDLQQLRWAKQRLLVRLDLHAIDLLTAA